jgi:hypothetical protein
MVVHWQLNMKFIIFVNYKSERRISSKQGLECCMFNNDLVVGVQLGILDIFVNSSRAI